MSEPELDADRVAERRQRGWILIVIGVLVAAGLVSIGLERQTDPMHQTEDAQGPCDGLGLGARHQRACEPPDETGNHAIILSGLVAGIAIAGAGGALLAKHPKPRT